MSLGVYGSRLIKCYEYRPKPGVDYVMRHVVRIEGRAHQMMG